ncbi:Replication factor C subunit 2 [Yarrowia sp. B02]|nr:Replication factor C subunit 2 [Yarrowia sp. B02]
MQSFFAKSQQAQRADGKKASKNKAPPPWVEKYRPKSLDDVSSQDHAVTVLKRTLGSANLPHMLFYGPPGTGKTSTVLALAKELYGPELMKDRVLELNASDERGIAIVRDSIKNFAAQKVVAPKDHIAEKYPCPPFKIIILDEADSMTTDAQSALRRTMETYSAQTRFCLICNYVTRIIDPLASRCSKFRFRLLDGNDALARLQHVSDAENLSVEDGVLEKILEVANGDLRRAITILQSCSRLRGENTGSQNDEDGDATMAETRAITISDVNETAGVIPTETLRAILKACRDTKGPIGDAVPDILVAVKELTYSGWSSAQITSQMHDLIITDPLIEGKEKSKIAELLSVTDKRLADGADESLAMLNLIVGIADALGGAK